MAASSSSSHKLAFLVMFNFFGGAKVGCWVCGGQLRPQDPSTPIYCDGSLCGGIKILTITISGGDDCWYYRLAIVV